MDLEQKQRIRSIYGELQGYLREAPNVGEHGISTTEDDVLWEMVSKAIDELNNVSGINYDKFKITGIKRGQFNNLYIYISEYRTKLGGLIARLHHTYFSDEPAPFSGMPSTSITLHNRQEQNQNQTMFLELKDQIEKKIKELPDGNEKSFLEKLKSGIGTVKDFTALIILISKLGKEYGIGMGDLANLFR